MSDVKNELHDYLQRARDAMLWKLDGLSEYDVRRPMVPTGTNLLGLIKHLASVELGYFGEVFGRPSHAPMPWSADDAEPNADMWATADESREELVALYRHAWAHADATIDALSLQAVGRVPWWPEDRREVTLHRILVHMIGETNRHGGQADIVRELIDGAVGARRDNTSMAEVPDAWWTAQYERLERVALEVESRARPGTAARDQRPPARYDVRPIAWVESPLAAPEDAPRQADEGAPEAEVVFEAEAREGLRSLEVGTDVVLLTWLHRAERNVLVVHPRGEPDRPLAGVFSTRSPDRPNPIGLHTVRILAVDDLRVRVGPLEAIDGTPVLDVKPVLGPREHR